MRFVLLALLGSVTAYADPAGPLHPSGAPATVVAAKPIPATLADAIPAEGLYLASHSEHVNDDAHDEMFIARLDRSGLHEVYRSPRWTSDLAWVDPTTLVEIDNWPGSTLPGSSAETELRILTMQGAGAPTERTLTIPASAWALRKGEALHSGMNEFDRPHEEVIVTRRGELWLGICVLAVGPDQLCKRSRYLRVLNGALTTRDDAPAAGPANAVAKIGVDPPMSSLPRLATPAGYAVKLAPIQRGRGGFVCTSPGGVHASADEPHDPAVATRPRRVQWLLANPTLFALVGDSTDPGTARDKPWQQFRRACAAQPMEDFRLLRPRIWAEKVSTPPTLPDADHRTYWSEEWRISIDDTVIGAVGGSRWTIAISPPR